MNYQGFYITFNDDIDENKGGYYCEIYNENDDNFINCIDYFTISEYDITKYDKLDKEQYVENYIYDNYNYLIGEKDKYKDFVNKEEK